MKKPAICICLALALLPGAALAQSEGLTEDARARGKQLFDSALADVKREDYKAACPKFRASYDVDPKASTLLNLGTCYERNGQTASAWGAFSNAVVAARKAGKEEWAAQAEERVKALEPRLVRLMVVVPPEARTEGLTVLRDASTLSESEWGLPMAVDPGEHTIRASAPGHVTWSTKVAVAEGSPPPPLRVPKLVEEKRSVVVGPGAAAVQPKFWTPSRLGGATLAGVGLVGVGVGAALAIVAKSQYDGAAALCPTSRCGNASAVADSESAFDLATGATLATVIGAVAGVAGLGLFLWAPDKKSYALEVVPVSGRGYAGLSAGGSF
jgi:hypothetical protein